MQYGGMFGVTAFVCVVGALLGLAIAGRHTHADGDGVASESPADDSDARALPEQGGEVTEQLGRPSGPRRPDADATARLPRGRHGL